MAAEVSSGEVRWGKICTLKMAEFLRGFVNKKSHRKIIKFDKNYTNTLTHTYTLTIIKKES